MLEMVKFSTLGKGAERNVGLIEWEEGVCVGGGGRAGGGRDFIRRITCAMVAKANTETVLLQGNSYRPKHTMGKSSKHHNLVLCPHTI